MNAVLVFDIETIPDAAGLRRLGDVPGTHANAADAADVAAAPSDAQVVEAAFAARREKTGSDFLPHHLQKVVAISCVWRDAKGFRVGTLGEPNDPEPVLIEHFFKMIERHAPQLISWNGGGFDLPVLHYRALVHGISSPRYWDMGQVDREFKWNNYISRYHFRHTDLMDVLALYQPRANAPLDAMAKLCGFPGKMGMDGSQVWPAYQAGEIAAIRNYCETDVVNTYLMYCRFQLMRGEFSSDEYADEVAHVKSVLSTRPETHWAEYLAGFGEPS